MHGLHEARLRLWFGPRTSRPGAPDQDRSLQLDSTSKNFTLLSMAVLTNQYEQAFAGWLSDNGFQYVAVDQQKRKILARSSIKTFDFLLYPPAGKLIVAELKGRKFKGSALTNMTGLECWVGIEDIRGLTQWEQVFDDPCTGARARAGASTGAEAEAFFIFAYELENVDVDTDGREVYCFNDRLYMFLAISLANYRTFMTDRSPSWQTVTMPAARFRQFAIPARRLMSGQLEKFSGDPDEQMTGICAGVCGADEG